MVKKIGPKKPFRHFIREWMAKRGLNNARLAGRLDCAEGTVSKLLNAQSHMTDDWLSRIAYALDCEVADLFRDPDRPSADDLLRTATPEQRRQAMLVIEALLKTSA